MGSGVTVGRRGGVLKSERPKGTDTKSLAVWSGMHTAGALYTSELAAHHSLGPALDSLDCCFSVTKSYPTLCDPMDCSTPGLPFPHCLSDFAQVHVH